MVKKVSVIPKMTSNNKPYGLVTYSNTIGGVFEGWRAFDKEINTAWQTANNITTGWLMYEFLEPKTIVKYSITSAWSATSVTPRDWFFEASNDKSNWDILSSITGFTSPISTKTEFEINNENSYKYYRIRVTAISGATNLLISELDMYEIVYEKSFLLKSNNKIYSLKSNEILHETNMTSNTAPAPFVASASTTLDSTYGAWKAFNGSNVSSSDCWISNAKTGWIQIDFGSTKKVNTLYLTNRNYNDTASINSSPKRFNILGSNDGVNFDILHKVENLINWTSNETMVFNFINNKSYRYYRLDIIENNGHTVIGIGEILYSHVSNLTQLPSDLVENFINYGTSSIENFNLINDHKNYILQDTISENADGLWVQEIDRKPLSIKFE